MKMLTRSFLAQKYDCDVRTLKQYLIEVGIKHSKKLLPIEVELLIARVGDWEKKYGKV